MASSSSVQRFTPVRMFQSNAPILAAAVANRSRSSLARNASSARTRWVTSRTTQTDPMIAPSRSRTGAPLTRRWRSSPVAGVRTISSSSLMISPCRARRGGASIGGRGVPSARSTSNLAAIASTGSPARAPNSFHTAGFTRVTFPSASANQISSVMLSTRAASVSRSRCTAVTKPSCSALRRW